MDATQWAQQQVGGFAKAMEEIKAPNNNTINHTSNNINSNNPREQPMVERRAGRPQKEQNLNCPRCNSTNTKFCYYNNYSLTQPRYFCKTCKRYWTQGGSLRNVPVGGGSRKNKRSSSSSSTLSILASSITQSSSTPSMPTNPKFLQGQDLNLAFPIQGLFHPMDHHHHHHRHQFHNIETNNTNENIPKTSALELLRSGIASRGSNLSTFIPMPMAMPMPSESNNIYPSSGLIPSMQEFKPRHDHHHHDEGDSNMLGSRAANNGGGGARLLFPFADMNKLASPTTTTANTTTQPHEIDHQSKAGNNHNQGLTGYWTGMLGGGTW